MRGARAWSRDQAAQHRPAQWTPLLAPGCSLQHGRYHITRLLRGGAAFQLYEAEDRRLGRSCVMRVHQCQGTRDAIYLTALLENEARLLATLSHPWLPRVTDHFSESDCHYLVTEHVSGLDLGSLLKARGPLPARQVHRWLLELLDVLEYLQRQDPPVLHRRIRPEALWLDDDGHVLLTDFGAARRASPGSASELAKDVADALHAMRLLLGERRRGTGASGELRHCLHRALSPEGAHRLRSIPDLRRELEHPKGHWRVLPLAAGLGATLAMSATIWNLLPARQPLNALDAARATPPITAGVLTAASLPPVVALAPELAQPSLVETSSPLHWQLPIEDGAQPVLAGGELYLAAPESLRALDEAGQTRWRLPLLGAALARGDQTLVAALPGGMVYGLDSYQGRVRWTAQAGPLAGPALAVADHLALVAAQNQLAAFDLLTGQAVWNTWLDSPTRVAPVADGQSAFVFSDSGVLHSIALDNGHTRWRIKPAAVGRTALGRAQGTVFVVGDGGA
ncbi:MAG: PQQ-binding-like beta-propeller repeat protein, partial [Deinococcus sp.]|nr:PQQ-binding-like beta-propeller repeat protein [Deinococcus sp.]